MILGPLAALPLPLPGLFVTSFPLQSKPKSSIEAGSTPHPLAGYGSSDLLTIRE